MKSTIASMKNILEEINSRLDDSEEWISEQEDREQWKSLLLNRNIKKKRKQIKTV